MFQHIRNSLHWSTKITLLTFTLALLFSVFSITLSEGTNLLLSLITVLMFILIGIIADTVGLAAATATESHFRAMASKKIKGAKEAAYIAKNAPMFSSLFNDVLGDIAGIISGAASAAVVIQLAFFIRTSEGAFLYILISIILTSVIAALTVGGKAVCKTVAIYQSTSIILHTGKVLYYINLIKRPFHKSAKRKTLTRKKRH